jgi:hypothetical protein
VVSSRSTNVSDDPIVQFAAGSAVGLAALGAAYVVLSLAPFLLLALVTAGLVGWLGAPRRRWFVAGLLTFPCLASLVIVLATAFIDSVGGS